VLIFWLAISLAPQLYYSYYLLVFDALPIQWVLRGVPFSDFLHLMRVADGSLADHFTGAVLWMMLVVGWLRWLALAQRELRPIRVWVVGLMFLSVNLIWHMAFA